MTEILCKWLNDEVKLSKHVDKASVAEIFASGYYVGEILHKYQLQSDFDAFSMGQTADAKLNNFTRLEPTLHLLQIPFDSNLAYDVMMMKHGIATRLLYQLYIALQRKMKNNLTGAAMETMRAAAPVKLEKIESGLYKQRLKVLVPREADLTLEKVSSHYIAKGQVHERKAMSERYKEMEAFEKVKQEQRRVSIEKSRVAKQKQTELLAKIQAATVHIPKPPPVKSLKFLNQKREVRRKKEAAATFTNIENFETHLKKLVAPSSSQDDEETNQGDGSIESSTEYLQRIKNRLEEDSTAREERAKRRRKVLVDQMKAHHAQEEALRQEQVVQRLMRQSQQERRIAVQLMQARIEKDTIRKNRIFQEKQNEARRLKDFKESLDREAELCRQAREDYEEELKREKELHERIMSDEAHNRYRAHYDVCNTILGSILDFSCKIAEYRELTERKVPDKLVREWREVVLAGQPLYSESERSKQDEADLKREELLDNQDFTEYKNMIGEWSPPEDAPSKPPPSNNNILGHVLHRMFSMVAPTPPSTPPPVFPEFSIRVSVIGKMFSGKSTCLTRLCQNHRIVRLSVDQLLAAAVESFQTVEIDTTAPLHSALSLEGLAQTKSVVLEATRQAIDNVDSVQLLEGEQWEGEEKQDAEKEVMFDEEGNEIPKKAAEPRYSLRARLGKQALSFLKKGHPVPDSILVDVLVEAIRKIPDGTGWVLDGFPTTLNQAILFEKALTGKDVAQPPAVKRKGSKKSTIVSDPKPIKKSPPVLSGIDVVIALDVNDELVLKRAHGRTVSKQTEKIYHDEFNPPPLGSQTGHGNTEQVVPVKDVAFDKEQVQHRLSHFHNNWSLLEKLYDEVSIIRHVDAEHDLNAVYNDLEQCLFDTLEKIQEKRDAEKEAQKQAELEAAAKEQQPPPAPSTPQPPPPPTDESDTPRPGSDASKKSKKSSESVKSPKGSGRGRKKESDEKDGKPKSRAGSGKSPKGKKKSRSPSPTTPEPVVEEQPGPAKPQPGDADWEYVDEELPHTLAHTLVPYWENTESNYLKMTKFIFRQIRSEREGIIRYLFTIRKDFREHLKRPDHKQIFISAWQKDYNEVSDDLRQDEEQKAELHQRLDDLRERLWDICDTRKEQVETERGNLMTEGWIEDHLGILTNHYLTLMQAEVDRFQDTIHVLKDYYGGMQDKIPGEIGPASNFFRLPLVELDIGGQDLSATHSAATIGSDTSVSPQASQLKGLKKSNEELENENEGGSLVETGSRTKIPLVQRGAALGTQQGEESVKAKKGKGAAAPPQDTESPTSDETVEEKTVAEAYNFALNLITTTVQSRVSDKEAEEEEERRLKEEEAKAKANMVPSDKKGGGKKGGNKSAKGKKGKGGKSKSPTPTPPTPVEEESEESIRKRETVVRLRDEYLAAIFQEEAGVKDRLELIRNRACLTLVDLHAKSDQAFLDMNDWLGARYLREMAAVDALSNFARHHIEEGEVLKSEMRLDQDEFIVNSERKVVSSPPPPPRPAAVETAQPDVFTVLQLCNLHTQFKDVAPGGVIINKAFVELLADTAALTHGYDALPDMWMNISYSQLLDLCALLAPQSEFIDWRKFLLLAAQPWPKPTCKQLLSIREEFVKVDVAGNGWITKDQYDLVDLWFLTHDNSRASSPEDVEDPYPYNRDRNLRDFFFTLFADWEQLPPRLDYVNMLVYFSADKDNLTGVFRALSVASGKLMPKFGKPADVLPAPDKEVNPEDAIASELPSEFQSPYKRVYIDLDPSPAPTVSPDVWWLVLHHGSSRLGDSHRFSMSEDPEEKYSMEKLRHVYCELGSPDGSALPIQVLVRHSVLQDAIASAKRHRLPDIRSIFDQQTLQALDTEEQAQPEAI